MSSEESNSGAIVEYTATPLVDFPSNFELNPVPYNDLLDQSVITTSTAQLPVGELSSKEQFGMASHQPRDLPCRYHLTLALQYETQMGEEVCVVGSLEEFGLWQDHRQCRMRWTPKHIWVAEDIELLNKPYFMYKYVVVKDGRIVKREKGANRIADLEAMPEDPLRLRRQASGGSPTRSAYGL